MVSQILFFTLKLIIFFSIVISSSLYYYRKLKDTKEKQADDFPPWISECPNNWVKIENMHKISCKNPRNGRQVNFKKLTNGMTKKEKNEFLCQWTKDNDMSWIGVDNIC